VGGTIGYFSKNQDGGRRHLVFAKNDDVGHALYYSFRRHLG